MRVRISEIDMDMFYLVARGQAYKQIAVQTGVGEQTVKMRMANLLRVFGAHSMPHLIAILIASDVLRLHDLYQDLDVEVFEYKKTGSGGRRSYRLTDVRLG